MILNGAKTPRQKDKKQPLSETKHDKLAKEFLFLHKLYLKAVFHFNFNPSYSGKVQLEPDAKIPIDP